MKMIPATVSALALVLSLPACTLNPQFRAVPASQDSSRAIIVKRPLYQPELHGSPNVCQISAGEAVPVTGQAVVETAEMDTSIVGAEAAAPAIEPGQSVQKTLLSIVGQVAIACATSGNCW